MMKTARDSAFSGSVLVFSLKSAVISISYQKCQFFDDGCVDLFEGDLL